MTGPKVSAGLVCVSLIDLSPESGGGLGVGGKVAGVLLAWLVGRACGKLSARVLPCLALAVPMKAKLRKLGANLRGRCLGEFNPDPLANYFGKLELAGHGSLEQLQHAGGRQKPIGFTFREVHR